MPDRAEETLPGLLAGFVLVMRRWVPFFAACVDCEPFPNQLVA